MRGKGNPGLHPFFFFWWRELDSLVAIARYLPTPTLYQQKETKMRPWRHVVIATATTAATALSFTNTHWDVWYADAFVISWNDNSTAVDLELFASGGNLTSDSARATIACLCFFFLFLFFSFLFCFICFQVWLVSLSLRYLVTLYYFQLVDISGVSHSRNLTFISSTNTSQHSS